jgi:predicted MFS family arabinose efflux permease
VTGKIAAHTNSEARLGGVLRQREFRLLWVGESVSQFGNAISLVILPLIAVEILHVGTFLVALLNAAAWLPWVLFGLLAGAWTDRTSKRRLMLLCDVVSALLFLSIPVTGWLHILSVAQLLVIALVTGIANVFFTTAYQAYLPIVVGSADLTEANAKMQASKSAAQFAGPGIGGVVAQFLGATIGLVVNAASFLVSAVCLLLIRKIGPEPAKDTTRARLHHEIADGLRFLRSDRYLRPLTAYAALVNLGFGGIDAILVVFLVRTVGLKAASAGTAMALIGAGGLIGALAARRLTAGLGTARALLICTIVSAPFALLMPLTSSGWGVLCVGGYAVSSAGIVAFNVINASFRQAYCPPEILGRVAASTFTLSLGCVPVGALLAGWLGAELGNRTALWILAGLLTLSGAPLVLSPLRLSRDLPTRCHPRAK